MLSEISQQSQTWRNIGINIQSLTNELNNVSEMIYKGKISRVILTGMGASFYALYPATIMLENAGIHAKVIETSELVYSYSGILNNRTLLIIVSQSGYTAEIQQLITSHDCANCYLISVTNNTNSPLAQAANLIVDLDCGIEKAPSTKTYTTTLLSLYLIINLIIGNPIEHYIHQIHNLTHKFDQNFAIWKDSIDILCEQLRHFSQFLFLGRGSSVSSAKASALLFNEAVKIESEGFELGQFLHGPIEVKTDSQCVVVFTRLGDMYYMNSSFHQKLTYSGRHILLVGQTMSIDGVSYFPLDTDIGFNLLPAIEIVPIQLLAGKLAQLHNIDPFEFSVASKVTTFESITKVSK